MATYSPTVTITVEKPPVKLSTTDLIIEQATQSKPVYSCGRYEKGAVLKNMRIQFCVDIRNFYFMSKILKDSERDDLNEIPSLMIRDNIPMYSSNPYYLEIGQIKLYADPKTCVVHRCQIEDLYSTNDGWRPTLSLKLHIRLIDKGQRVQFVHHKHIYDFSQRTSHLAETEEEARRARLDRFGDHPENKEIFQAFKDFVDQSPRNLFNIKICGCEGGDSPIYLVDVIRTNNQSFLGLIQKTDNDRVIEPYPGKTPDFYPLRQLMSLQRRRKAIKHKENCEQQNNRQPRRLYNGAVDYFRQQLYKQYDNSDVSLMKKNLLEVCALEWYGPDHIAIVPSDKEYTRGHKNFLERIRSLKCVASAANTTTIHLYKPGELIIFENVFFDDDLGEWLRGVVVSMSTYDEHRLLIGQRPTHEEKLSSYKTVKRLIEDGKVIADDVIYRVRSVDYGCEYSCSPVLMRRVTDLGDFKRIGPWSLRCRLYGVHKYNFEKKLSRAAITSFDMWMRHKILENGIANRFHILLRTTIQGQQLFDKQIDISLFFKNVPKTLCGNYMIPEQIKYEYINWILVESGQASSTDERGNSINVQLEDCVMEMLVKFGKI